MHKVTKTELVEAKRRIAVEHRRIRPYQLRCPAPAAVPDNPTGAIALIAAGPAAMVFPHAITQTLRSLGSLAAARPAWAKWIGPLARPRRAGLPHGTAAGGDPNRKEAVLA